MKPAAVQKGVTLLGAAALACALAVLLRGDGLETPLLAQAPGASAPGVLISSTPLGDGSVVVCLLDTVRQRLAVYQVEGKRGRLKLLAVRDISADWRLSDYNNDPPLPKDIRRRVESLPPKTEEN